MRNKPSVTTNSKKIRLYSSIYLALGLIVPLTGKAITPTDVKNALQGTGSVNPARIGDVLAAPLVPATTAGVSTPGYQPLATTDAALRTRFTLTQLNVVGASVYGNAQIANMFRNYIGRTVSLADLQQMADTITLKYRKDGYILTRAIVPAQNVSNGVATIRVVEGFVNHVTIEGEPKGARKLLESYADRIEQARPLNIATLERYALLANDIPGVTVHVVLSPAQMPSDELAPSEIIPGAANLAFVVDQHTASGYATFDNRGTRYLGPNEYSFGANINSIFRSGDSTGFQGLVTPNVNDLQYIKLYHQTPIGDDGMLLNVAGSYTHSEPQFLLAPLDVVGRSSSVSAGLAYPAIRARNQSLFLNLGVDATDSSTEALGVNLYTDRLRSVRVGANYNANDSWLGSNQLIGQISQGIPAFGASPVQSDDTSRPNGHSDYTKFNGTMSRLQGLTHNFSIYAAAQGQYAVQPVLSEEEFTFGGAQFGQAYDPAELSGDRGVAAKAELRYDVYPNMRGLQGVQPFTFYDIGKVWNIQPIGQIPSAGAASVGVGVRANFTHFLGGSVEWAQPLHHDVATEGAGTGGTAPRVFFSITLAGDTPSSTTALPLPPPPQFVPSGTGLKPITPAAAPNPPMMAPITTASATPAPVPMASPYQGLAQTSSGGHVAGAPLPTLQNTNVSAIPAAKTMATATPTTTTPVSSSGHVSSTALASPQNTAPTRSITSTTPAPQTPIATAAPTPQYQGLTPVSSNPTVTTAPQATPTVANTSSAVSTNTAPAAATPQYQGLTEISSTPATQTTNSTLPTNSKPNNIAATSTTTAASTTNNYYVLQLRSGRDLDDLKRFAASHDLMDKVNFIHTQYQGGDWYVLGYGHYDSARAAAMASKQLPADLQRLHPWARQVG